jgi:hypothetical protein
MAGDRTTLSELEQEHILRTLRRPIALLHRQLSTRTSASNLAFHCESFTIPSCVAPCRRDS